MDILKEFIGFGGYAREAEGFMSWQHLLFVTILNVLMAVLAFVYGLRMRGRPAQEKNRVLVTTAAAINAVELTKIILICWRSHNPMGWLNMLPLFLCSVQLIAIPLAAFSHGRLREAALDFVCIFGLLGAILGTYCAGNNYSCYPVLGLDNVASGITHTMSGFASLYILISGMGSLKKENVHLTFLILLGFCTAAYLVNQVNPCNYMFLTQGDGTPYDILYNLVDGNPVLYPLGVIGLFLLYITVYYRVCFLIRSRKYRRHAARMA
ncbi:MAG: YwaF family protein [Clostridia bacterium]|nr:YwaF family protein [Clostridia bacterium]